MAAVHGVWADVPAAAPLFVPFCQQLSVCRRVVLCQIAAKPAVKSVENVDLRAAAHLSRPGKCMWENVLHVPAEGAARALGQHHEGGQPVTRQAAGPAFRQTGAEMVRLLPTTDVFQPWGKRGGCFFLFCFLGINVLTRLPAVPVGTCRASKSCWIMKTETQRMLTLWMSKSVSGL